jgi:hypothetical protein
MRLPQQLPAPYERFKRTTMHDEECGVFGFFTKGCGLDAEEAAY